MLSSILFSLRLSVQVATVATFFVVLVGIAIAYVLAMKNFRGKTVLDVACTLPLVLPPSVTGYYLIILFGRNGMLGSFVYELTGWSIMFTWQAAVLASFVVALPLMIRTTRAALETVDPEFIRVSYTLGRSELETFYRITLPLAKRGIYAGAVLAFARAMGEFGATIMVAGNIPGRTATMPIAIYSAAGSGDWQQAHIMVALFTAISAGFLLIANKFSKK
ncbi:MAG: molybdate ABC transporter permease subunit, partial [Deltaproteobacteria bacterium]|nr:molybdate ABC transporter permease subunit [Deltaproteobacteria bacterium]